MEGDLGGLPSSLAPGAPFEGGGRGACLLLAPDLCEQQAPSGVDREKPTAGSDGMAHDGMTHDGMTCDGMANDGMTHDGSASDRSLKQKVRAGAQPRLICPSHSLTLTLTRSRVPSSRDSRILLHRRGSIAGRQDPAASPGQQDPAAAQGEQDPAASQGKRAAASSPGPGPASKKFKVTGDFVPVQALDDSAATQGGVGPAAAECPVQRPLSVCVCVSVCLSVCLSLAQERLRQFVTLRERGGVTRKAVRATRPTVQRLS